MSLVWLITGTSSGIGHVLAQHLLKRGEKVIATGRNLAALDSLKSEGAHTLQLDVSAPLEALRATAQKAFEVHGRIDVVVNNAGYIQIGALEECTPEETMKQFNTNVFGALNVTRAFLPYQRKAKSGTVVFIGSVGGWRGNGGSGLYGATKHAIRAVAEALDQEISPLGLRSLYIEPGFFRTSFLEEGKRSSYEPRIDAYADLVMKRFEMFQAISGKQPGDPGKLAELLIDYVRREGIFAAAEAGDAYPGGIPVGTDSYNYIKQRLESQLALLERWKTAICSTEFSE